MSETQEKQKKEQTECGWFGHAGWSANPNDKGLPFEYCKDCSKQEKCRNKDLGNQEENAIESAYDQMYGQEAEQE
ncbi:MAG: hypothetical protein ABSG57_04960 [Candidatus Bathyarchaeia archaeon]